ncbi:DUF3159 domain-containing protein [uncultured Amnibacterium sp.]|uniref:DUF3159 domain-containing protein n=1 Tax=uncultured Amnibacterium sp. TaxID=1631851 RepID=UPI0035CC88F2
MTGPAEDPQPGRDAQPGRDPQPDRDSDGAGAALRAAAAGEQLRLGGLLAGIGGPLGIVEGIVPSLAFLVLFTLTRQIAPAVVVPVVLGLLFLAYRLIRHQQPSSAVGGLFALVVSAVLALVTGRASAAFLPGILLNGGYGVAMLISLLVGWPLIGVLVGALLREGSAWRADPVKRRLFTWLTILWLGLFAVRLLVEVPLYLALGEATTVRLAWVRLVLGVPLYAPVLVVTLLAVQSVYRRRPAPDVS